MISAPGVGSGLDVNSIVTQLVAIERQPIAVLQQTAASVQTKISTYGAVQSAVSSLRDTALALTQTDTWGQSVGTSSDPTAVAVATNASSRPGIYSVSVSSLAAGQTNSTGTFAAADTIVGEGTLSIELGAWAGTSFTASAAPVNITIGESGTVTELREAINAANAGVTASILTDASGSRLVLRSTETGAENGFRVTVADGDGDNTDTAGLSALAYDPQAAVSTMARSQLAANAVASIDGLVINSASNVLPDVIDGISLTLSKVTTAPVQLTVTQDNDAIKSKLDAFANAYNDVNNILREQTKFDAATGVAGVLQGDSAALSMRSQLRNVLGVSSGASSVFTRLSEVGFDVKADGSIALIGSKLDGGLSNLVEMQKLFSNSDLVTPSNRGVAVQLRELADTMLGIDGTLQSRTEGLQRRLDSNQDRQDRLTDRVAEVERRLRAQYTLLDQRMGLLNGLANLVTQQFGSTSS